MNSGFTVLGLGVYRVRLGYGWSRAISVQPPPSWQDLRTHGEFVIMVYHNGGGEACNHHNRCGGGGPRKRVANCARPLGATRGYQWMHSVSMLLSQNGEWGSRPAGLHEVSQNLEAKKKLVETKASLTNLEKANNFEELRRRGVRCTRT